MNKQEQFKKLVWKKFWKQKKEELKTFFKLLIPILIIAGTLIGIVFFIYSFPDGINKFNLTYFILGIIPFGGWIIFGISYWLHSNWKKAVEETKKELKMK